MTDDLSALAGRWRHLPPALAADAARQDQDARWAAGDRVPAERYLALVPRVAGSPDDALVVIYGEVANRTALGETADVAEYVRRFPRLADRLRPLFEVHDGLSTRLLLDPPRPPADVAPAVPGYAGLTPVGRGGMGVVYRGFSEADGRPVAVKVVTAARDDQPEPLVRFLQEGEILARLDHPHIVRLLAAGASEGRPYLVMEWVEGGTLADRIAGRPQPAGWSAGVVAALARAVGYAHRKGVVHRDLKPRNVLLTAGGSPKLADFGVARLVNCGGLVTRTGQVVGTVNYIPPEQLVGRPSEVGPAADVYGLGAVLYELLTGRPPFLGPTPVAIARQVLADPPIPPADLNPDVSVRLSDLCLWSLAKRPADRPPSADALAKELSRDSMDRRA